MKAFRWNRQFETGLSDVDDQHRHLVDLINAFGAQVMRNRNRNDAAAVAELRRELTDYAGYHFREEEELMECVGVDQRHIEAHKQAHRDFLFEVGMMAHEDPAGNEADSHQILDFLNHWLAYHILGVDQNLAGQIRAIEAGATAAEAFDDEERRAEATTEPLLTALNALFRQLSIRNRQLGELNRLLERKVAKRTRALEEANLHLETLSVTDALTSLPNRRYAMRSLATLWAEARPESAGLVCIMIDADHFKEINDTYGHDAGDLVLQEVARSLRHSVRSDDIVCRLGGDEFLVVCPDTSLAGGLTVAANICKTVSTLRVPTGEGNWQGSVSVGVAARTPATQSHDELIKLADRAVYAAKRAGKNCVRRVESGDEAPVA